MSKDWSNGLFSCFGDGESCFKSFCCPCCAAGEIYFASELGSCPVGCAIFCLLGACWPCVVTGPIRKRKDINGGCCTDTIIWCFCAPCQLTRELREVRGT